jgi:hypothetical protein
MRAAWGIAGFLCVAGSLIGCNSEVEKVARDVRAEVDPTELASAEIEVVPQSENTFDSAEEHYVAGAKVSPADTFARLTYHTDD